MKELKFYFYKIILFLIALSAGFTSCNQTEKNLPQKNYTDTCSINEIRDHQNYNYEQKENDSINFNNDQLLLSYFKKIEKMINPPDCSRNFIVENNDTISISIDTVNNSPYFYYIIDYFPIIEYLSMKDLYINTSGCRGNKMGYLKYKKINGTYQLEEKKEIMDSYYEYCAGYYGHIAEYIKLTNGKLMIKVQNELEGDEFIIQTDESYLDITGEKLCSVTNFDSYEQVIIGKDTFEKHNECSYNIDWKKYNENGYPIFLAIKHCKEFYEYQNDSIVILKETIDTIDVDDFK